MLTLLDELSADEAMPDGTFDSARPKQQQAQLELFELDSNTTAFSTYVEEDPIVHRRIIHDVNDSKWIRRIAKEIEEIVPYWSWQKYISNLVDALSGSVAKQVRNILKKAARKVAVKTAQGQPPFHKYSNYRPKSCQVFRFGPQARGPPQAIEAVYAQAQIQTCIVHLIHNSKTLACSFAGQLAPLSLPRPPCPRERRAPVVNPLEPQFFCKRPPSTVWAA
jgi:hypothetical protein